MSPLIAGNWKMNGLAADLDEAREVAERAPDGVDVLLCLPATLIREAARIGGALSIGGQDCHRETSGAHTGDVSAAMLADAGATHVIVGHSERRADHGEANETVRAKAEAALDAGLIPIVCIGETEEERADGRTNAVLEAQLRDSMPRSEWGKTVVAYEPVWAIGTGRTASVGDVEDAHRHIANVLSAMRDKDGAGVRILYGGSVKPGNAAELLAVDGVHGALVGGASLKASDFLAICGAAPTG